MSSETQFKTLQIEALREILSLTRQLNRLAFTNLTVVSLTLGLLLMAGCKHNPIPGVDQHEHRSEILAYPTNFNVPVDSDPGGELKL